MATQSERRERTRALLVEAALSRFGSAAYARVGVDELANSVGVTRGALYHHFSGKRALFEAAVHAAEQQLVGVITTAAGQHDDPVEQIRAGIQAFIDTAAQAPYHQILIVDGPAVLGRREFREIDDTYFATPTAAIVRAARPDLAFDQVEALACVLIAASCELVSRVGTSHITRSAAHATMDHLVRTIAP